MGRGVEKDLVQAYKWVSLAASAGNETSADRLPEIESQMTPDQLAQAKALAKEWKRGKSAKI